jgi:prephenate dehydrogenase
VTPFARVAIVGVGLIGGSLGMAVRRRGLAREVIGVTRTADAMEAARLRGAIDRGTLALEDAVAGADLVVLATPPDAVVPAARQALPHLRPDAILTDVASVKGDIVRAIEAMAERPGAVFVGGHPMAGNEGSGVASADAELFEGAVYVLTPTERVGAAAVARLADLARAIGASPVVLAPDAHDRAVAIVSHLPYLIAAALVGVADGAAGAAGPAFLGATRVAASPVELWTQICRLNRAPIAEALAAFRSELAQLEAALDDRDRTGALLERARAARVRLGAARGEA